MSMTREEAISILEESKRQNKVMIDNPSMFWRASQTASGVKNAEQRIMALDMAIAALRPVSREQVILCKDCQYWQGNNGGYPHPECRWGNDETPDEDDYCSFAERLEVSKNG